MARGPGNFINPPSEPRSRVPLLLGSCVSLLPGPPVLTGLGPFPIGVRLLPWGPVVFVLKTVRARPLVVAVGVVGGAPP